MELKKLELRDYQQATADRLLEDGRDGVCSLAVLPTGAGKTVILRAVIEGWLRDFPDHQILLLAHRTRLLEQARECFVGIPVQTISAGLNAREAPQPGSVTVAGIQTLAGNGLSSARLPSASLTRDWDLVLVDEAHRVGDTGQYADYLTNLPRDPAILGVTATPWRMDNTGKHQLLTRIPGAIFQRVACWVQPEDLIQRGFLLRPEMVPVRHAFPRAGFKLDHGEIAASGVSRYLHLDFDARMAEILEKTADARRILIFCETVKDARRVAESLDASRHPARFIDGTMPEAKRRNLLQALQEGSLRYLVNVDVFTEGLDVPEIDAVVLLCMTQSVPRFLQKAGRGLRPAALQAAVLPGAALPPASLPGASPTCRFLDYGHHIERLGAIEASRGEDARPLDARKRQKCLVSAVESARWKAPSPEDVEKDLQSADLQSADLPDHLTSEANFTVWVRETRVFPIVARNGKNFMMMRFSVDDPMNPPCRRQPCRRQPCRRQPCREHPSDAPTTQKTQKTQKRIWIERKLHPQDPLFAPLWDRWSMLSGTTKKRAYHKDNNPVETLLEKRASGKGFCRYDPFALRIRWSDRAHRWMIDGMQWEGRKIMHITSEEDAALSGIVQELKGSTNPRDQMLFQFLFRVASEGILEYREGKVSPEWMKQQKPENAPPGPADGSLADGGLAGGNNPLRSASPSPGASLPAASSLPGASSWPSAGQPDKPVVSVDPALGAQPDAPAQPVVNTSGDAFVDTPAAWREAPPSSPFPPSPQPQLRPDWAVRQEVGWWGQEIPVPAQALQAAALPAAALPGVVSASDVAPEPSRDPATMTTRSGMKTWGDPGWSPDHPVPEPRG
ncbi:DEAD/DEAH box helicase family protein [Acidithiobacillus sp. MC6.1]|nr:DEAD/DEAH box helicase family protein [Acidithiobacillus sp. MC6.1]